jgi:uncharacterized integral membrane protein
MKFPMALFLVVLIFLALVGQNLSPSLSLVLLGMKSIAFPVGVWVVLAIASGAITAGVISLFFPRSNSTRTSKSRQRRSVSPPPPQDPDLGGETPSSRAAPQTVYTPPSNTFEGTEDIEVEYASVRKSPIREQTNASQPSGEEVWDDEEEWESAQPTNGAIETPKYDENRRVVEVQKNPISSDRQGSIYSYSYRSTEDVRIPSSDFADNEEDEETLDLRDIVPEPQIDPLPKMEIIDPILEPENPREKRTGAAFPQEKRSSPKPQPQNQKEDDWGEKPNNEEEDW